VLTIFIALPLWHAQFAPIKRAAIRLEAEFLTTYHHKAAAPP